MKKTLLFFVMLFPLWVLAQDYQAICRPGTTYFMAPDSTQKAVRIVQTVALTGGDTVFYTYPAIRDSIPGSMGICRDTTAGDALGRRIHKRSNGMFYFFNKDRDTVAIYTQALLNGTWRFCSLPGGDYIEATVTAIGTGNVINTTDMVKTITLQTKNQAGTSIAGLFNGKTIKLSRLYGLVECWDIYRVPYDTLRLELHVLTHPPMGPQPYGWQEVYDFAVGDEFHRVANDNFGSGTAVTRTIERVIGKTIYGNNDSVTYTFARCEKKVYPVPPPNVFTYQDTADVTYNFQVLAGDLRIGLLPDEFIHLASPDYVPLPARIAGKFNGREVQECNEGAYFLQVNCYTDPFETFGPVYRYAPGLGQVHFEYFEADITMHSFTHDLVYFRKGGETWGTPVASDCDALLTHVANINEPAALTVTPNPATGNVTISTGERQQGEELHYVLFSPDGRLVASGEATMPSFVLSRAGHAPGVYVLVIRDAAGAVVGRARVVWY